MARPYEDPRKTALRERCEVAVDAAGYSLRPVLPIPYAPGSKFKGAIVGDLQAVDVDGAVHVYYLRPESNKALPQWLMNLSDEARRVDGVRLYVIVETLSDVIERTCRGSGTGLLRLDDSGKFEIVVEIGEGQDAAKMVVRAKVGELRRKLETKLDLNVNDVEKNFGTVKRATSGMTEKKRDSYLKDVERQLERWKTWGDGVSSQLDEVAASGRGEDIPQIEVMIEAGPETPGDDA